MRIATHQMQQAATAALLDQQARLARNQLQLSTGKRLLSAADDPAGAVQALDLNGVIGVTQQYQRNIGRARSRLELEETVLRKATDLLQRARDLAVQGGNAALSAADRRAMGAEVRQLLQGLLETANTRDPQGEYLFAGYRSLQEPFQDNGDGTFSYLGDAGVREVQIGPTRRVAVGDAGRGVFMEVPGLSGDAFAVLQGLAAKLDAGQPPPSQNLDDLDRVMDHLASVRGKVGARLNALDAQQGANEDALLQYRRVLSGIEDLDYAAAISEFQSRLTALQAAQRSFTRVQGLSLFQYL